MFKCFLSHDADFFVVFSVHETVILLLKKHISVASIVCCVRLFNFQDSQPYSNMDLM